MKEGYGMCPLCAGSGRVTVPENMDRYKHVIAGYDKETNTLGCTNCGGQYMYGKPKGEVRLNKQGDPCKHSYKSSIVGRCLTQYICDHCSDSYQIDSGD